MNKQLGTLACAIAVLAVLFGSAGAGVLVRPQPLPVRVAQADVVFVGKVIDMEPMDIDAKAFPDAKETSKYRIAVVEVSKVVTGLKDEKKLRVGFLANAKPGLPSLINPKLTVNQEGLFLISKHEDGKFYQAPRNGFFIAKDAKTFEDDVKTATKAVATLANTKTALESKDADKRLTAAAMLVAKYRTQKPPFPNKEEPIDAAESKLILNAIATAKWGSSKFDEINPQMVWFQLGIGANDGWTPPKQLKTPDDMREAVQAWLKKHEDYRVKKFVPSPDKQ
jgi:hypothetical protein